MQGELKMLINLRNNAGKLVVKDILDIDFDMSVEEKNNKYSWNNPKYKTDDFSIHIQTKNPQKAHRLLQRILN